MKCGSWTSNFLTFLDTTCNLTHPTFPNLSAITSSRPQPPQSQLPVPSSLDLEMGRRADDTLHTVLDAKHGLAWEKIVVSFCLASASELAVASIQEGHHFPPMYCLYSAAVILAFTLLFVSKYISSNAKYLTISHALQHISIFFVATAFFVAMTIPFHFWLRCSSWAIYAIAILTILACRFS
ncbi:hypothetical protein ACJRO7_009853 [Eucalyptus globulus]|uniref:Uncharacterized protein n=1 Tax=Eucalyptus globulus TaxID=34317 RepID=A0ABD3LK23_EUCGL